MLDKTNHSLEIARTSRENAANLAALLREEIKEIRSFMEQQRLPTKMMTKRLDVHFKGRIPSEMYASAERELELRKGLDNPMMRPDEMLKRLGELTVATRTGRAGSTCPSCLWSDWMPKCATCPKWSEPSSQILSI